MTSTAPLLFAATTLLALMAASAPDLGISLTAPCFGLLALERLTRRSAPSGAPVHLALASLFVAGCGLSLAARVWGGDAGELARGDLLLLVRFGYWAAVLALTADALARAPWTPRLAHWAAVCAAGLAALRLLDGLFQGGLHHEPRWLSQNDYGLRFSLFIPFLIGSIVGARRGASAGWTLALAGALAVVLLNGSRSAWVTVALASGVILAIHWLAGRLRIGALAGLAATLACCAALPWLASGPLRGRLQARWDTLSRLETDKPVLTRKLLVEKGLLLFDQRPLFGQGLGGFSRSRVRLVSSQEAWLTDADLSSRSAHNAYVKVLAETGLAGALPLLALLGWLALRGGAAAVRLTRRGHCWAATAYGSFLAVSAHLWTLSGLTGTEPWFIYGWVAAAIVRDQAEGRA